MNSQPLTPFFMASKKATFRKFPGIGPQTEQFVSDQFPQSFVMLLHDV